MLKINDSAPDFIALDQNDKEHRLDDYAGQWLLLYFYPRDNTPGCTKEACAMRDNYSDYKKYNANILGVSTDSIKSHIKFAKKHELQFSLLSDSDKKLSKSYGVGGLNRRKSYLINPAGKIAKIYLKVKSATHASEVLADIIDLSK